MAHTLSDEELRQKLENLGEKVGPVTPTTRRVLQKRLDTILKSPNRSLNTLSSDDSEIENQGLSERRKKRHNHRSSHVPISHQLSNLILSDKKEVFKKPLPTSRNSSRLSIDSPLAKNSEHKAGQSSRKSYSGRKSNFDLEISDSDMDTDTLLSPMQMLKVRNRSTNHVSSDSGVGYLNVFKRPNLASTPNGDKYARTCQNDQNKSDSVGNLSKSYRLSRSTDNKYSRDYNANGYLSNDPLNGIFASGNKGSEKTSNNWVYISWLLVAVIVSFFIFLGISYASAVQKTQLAASTNHLNSLICKHNESDCIPPDYFKPVVLLSRDLHDLLSMIAGEFECQMGRKSRNLTVSDTKKVLETTFSNHDVESFDEVFEYALLLSLKNPDWGISMYTEDGTLIKSLQEARKTVRDISALESKHASKSLWCRIQYSVNLIVSRLLIIFSVLAVLGLIFFGVKLWRKHRDLQEKEFYELVEKILDILQTPDEMTSPGSSTSLPCKAVVHLRDKIIPLKERQLKQHLWERAVSFIEENESRVQVDFSRIGGEDFKVWRWLPSPTSDTEEGKKGKVWQGQAFGNLSKGTNNIPYSPTACLKIRNMFDYEVEYGDDWQICIKDAILEKCEGNKGIVHIAVDTTSKEGCIYMLCDCPESAGKVYSALHGWWFDGKLVTVKYLRLERYLKRFPEAEECGEPLQPSNNKRLSLSAPFFSSALERS